MPVGREQLMMAKISRPTVWNTDNSKNLEGMQSEGRVDDSESVICSRHFWTACVSPITHTKKTDSVCIFNVRRLVMKLWSLQRLAMQRGKAQHRWICAWKLYITFLGVRNVEAI